MKKNKRNQEVSVQSERSQRRADRRAATSDRNATAILLLALLFFLFGLLALAYAAGFRIIDENGFNPSFGNRRGTQSTPQNGARGTNGTSGTAGTAGNAGRNGTNTNTDDDGTNTGLNDLNLNVQNDSVGEVDAGIQDGNLRIDPNLNPNGQGGTGTEVNLNEDNIIDTGSILR